MEEFDISNMNEESLSSLQSDQLVKIILALNKENENFKKTAEDIVAKRYDERLERLEREINKDKQYIRRETIEFSGISQDVGDDAIEDECLKILKAAKVKVGNRFPSTLDIHAAHRKGRKGIVILKFGIGNLRSLPSQIGQALKTRMIMETYSLIRVCVLNSLF